MRTRRPRCSYLTAGSSRRSWADCRCANLSRRLPTRRTARKLTVHDVLVSAEGHLRAVAYYLYDWRLKDGSRVSFDCADVFNFDPSTGRIQSIVLVYDTHPVRPVVAHQYP